MNEQNKTVIHSVTYRSVERTIDWFVQKQHQTIHHIYLYSDTITTTNNTFQLDHVHDISYRPFSSGTGLFYLHTNQGVFTYDIDMNPKEFIREYKKLRDGDSIFF
ncbi:hypothetical protein [Sporosarcina sp. FA9]|uniref:hypothetical protein n=1 Tax=Sporosarcina sp. FA9 TaxID=3413030 RepID=UPI003F6582BA